MGNNKCLVPNCENIRQSAKHSFFKFPKEESRRQKWLQILKLENHQLYYHSTICQDHFKIDQFSRTRLKRDALPFNTNCQPARDSLFVSNSPQRQGTPIGIEVRGSTGLSDLSNSTATKRKFIFRHSASQNINSASPQLSYSNQVNTTPVARPALKHITDKENYGQATPIGIEVRGSTGLSDLSNSTATKCKFTFRHSASQNINSASPQLSYSNHDTTHVARSLFQNIVNKGNYGQATPIGIEVRGSTGLSDLSNCTAPKRQLTFRQNAGQIIKSEPPQPSQLSRMHRLSGRSPRINSLKSYAIKISNLRLQTQMWRMRYTRLEKSMSKKSSCENVDRILSNYFGQSSIKELLVYQFRRYSSSKESRKQYCNMERIIALTIYYSCGARGYRNLRQTFQLKLPNISTLLRWLRKLTFKPGLNDELFHCIADKVDKFTEAEKDCVLMFDEMTMKRLLLYSKYDDELEGIQDHGHGRRVLKMADHALVFLLRGINGNWKLPISFYFNHNVTSTSSLVTLITENVRKVANTGLRIRVIVCDQGTTNQGCYSKLGVNKDKPYAIFDNVKIYMIHDAPHLIKCTRNNVLKHGFKIGENYISWRFFEQLWDADQNGINRLAPKLSKNHLDLPDYSKMKVKLATQLLSHTVSAAIKTCVSQDKMTIDAMPTAEFAEDMNTIFDLLNISSANHLNCHKSGVQLMRNRKVLLKWSSWVGSWEMGDDSPIVASVKGLQITLNGIYGLLNDLHSEGYKYLLTRKIQQDAVEHFNSAMRYKGGWSQNPTTRAFKQNFRFIFVVDMIKNPLGGNCEDSPLADKVLFNNYHKLECILKGTTAKNPKEQFTNESDSEFEESCESDSHDDVRINCDINDFLQFRNRSTGMLCMNACVYMANHCAKKIISATKCQVCMSMLEFPMFDREDPGFEIDESFLLNKARNDKTVYRREQNLSYGHVLNEKATSVFKTIVSSLPQIVGKEAFNFAGLTVKRNILRHIRRIDSVSTWLNDSCVNHRTAMIDLYIKTSIFSWVKRYNEGLKDSKSNNQTRQDLRFQ